MNLFTKLTFVAAMAASAAAVSAQDRTDLLWVLGDATPYGWSCDDATALVANADGKVYTGTMYLEAGKDFKFLTKYDFGNAEYRSAVASATPDADGKVALVLTSDGDDNKIQVTESANYLISVDTEALQATIVKSAYQETQVPYASLFIIGSVLESGYSVDQGLTLTQNVENPVEFSVSNAALKSGNFKIATVLKGAGTWQGKYWYFCGVDNPDVMVLNQEGDNQWPITEDGNYDIKANIATNAISIVKSEEAGVETVEAAGFDCDVPAVYYSIDGRKVTAPAAGSLVIKVTADGTATKVRF